MTAVSRLRPAAFGRIAALLLLASLAFWAGLQAWSERSDEAVFYQEYLSPAVALHCGHGLRQILVEKRWVVRKFLADKEGETTCAEAFSAENDPQLAPLAAFQRQTAALMTTFAALWTWTGITWSATAYLVGALVAATALATFAFARLFFGFFPSLLLAGALPLLMTTVTSQFVQVRDFSKAPFMIGLAALVVHVLVAERRRLPPYGLAAGLVVVAGVSFRMDVAIFLALVPLACALRLIEPGTRAWAASALILFVAVAWAWNLLVFDYAATLGQFNAHYGLLGRATDFRDILRVGSAHQGAFRWYNDSAVHLFARLYAAHAGLPEPAWGTAAYDQVTRALLGEIVTTFPASHLALALRASFKALFWFLPDTDDVGLPLLTLCSVTLAGFFHRRGLAAMALCAALGGIAVVQFHPRHFFYLEILGAVLASATGAALLLAAAAFIRRRLGRAPAGLGSALCPPLRPFSLAYAALPLAALALFHGALALARPFERGQVEEMIRLISGFPRYGLAPLPPTPDLPADTRLFDASILLQSTYMRLDAEGCARLPVVSILYGEGTPYNLYLYEPLPVPGGRVDTMFFPVLVEPGRSRAAAIRLDGLPTGCQAALSALTPTAKFLPLIFYARPPSP